MDIDSLVMLGTQEERRVARYEAPDRSLIVDTCEVIDSDQPYETAVSDLRYNPGKWYIVEEYDTREAAQKGHDQWIARMTSPNPPKELVMASTSHISKMDGYVARTWPNCSVEAKEE